MIAFDAELKEVHWRGDSRSIARSFPKRARMKLGKELTRIQMGLQPRDGKWLSGVGRGVQEIRIADSNAAYRVIYLAILEGRVYVLHAFQKKSRVGIATPRSELDVAGRRYREVMREERLRL